MWRAQVVASDMGQSCLQLKFTEPNGSCRTVPKIQLNFPIIDEYVLVLSGKLILTDAGDDPRLRNVGSRATARPLAAIC